MNDNARLELAGAVAKLVGPNPLTDNDVSLLRRWAQFVEPMTIFGGEGVAPWVSYAMALLARGFIVMDAMGRWQLGPRVAVYRGRFNLVGGVLEWVLNGDFKISFNVQNLPIYFNYSEQDWGNLPGLFTNGREASVEFGNPSNVGVNVIISRARDDGRHTVEVVDAEHGLREVLTTFPLVEKTVLDAIAEFYDMSVDEPEDDVEVAEDLVDTFVGPGGVEVNADTVLTQQMVEMMPSNFRPFVMSIRDVNTQDLLDGIDTLIETAKYQGFDPALTRKIMFWKGAADRQMFIKDIQFLIIALIVRGTKIEKMKRSSTTTFAAEIQRLASKYTIQDTKPTLVSHVTMGRIGAAFPEQIVLALHQKGNVIPASLKVDGATMRFVPRCIQTPVFPSVVPRTSLHQDDVNLLLGAHRLFQLEFDLLIHSGDKGYRQNVQSIENFQRIAFDSGLISETRKMALFRTMGFLNAAENGLVRSLRNRLIEARDAV